MTSPANNVKAMAMKKRPEGWPVASFDSYDKAQAAVDMLSDQEFPVKDLTIVGVDLMEVERVQGRLTWGKVLLGGAVSGAWAGLFFGLLFGLFYENWLVPLLTGAVLGVIFGLVSVSVPYAASKGKRDFASSTQIVAGRYDILCEPHTARQARDSIARSEIVRPRSNARGEWPQHGGAAQPEHQHQHQPQHPQPQQSGWPQNGGWQQPQQAPQQPQQPEQPVQPRQQPQQPEQGSGSGEPHDAPEFPRG
ncbi:hypothetical protein CCICO_04510 [Corynebacterium ciconiae DSM 44920]|nr:hypothetical protein CCICO_04510 [Corynebacterium ciconiae DSM 44920]